MESTFSSVEPESCPLRAQGIPLSGTTHATKSGQVAKLRITGTHMMRIEGACGRSQRKEDTIMVSDTKQMIKQVL